ncbi:phosphoesterase [Candidatus Gottesmanbacteria bacterium]|nr:phosphoesterase [Candidatus Gottesmanbacteria bacterium]
MSTKIKLFILLVFLLLAILLVRLSSKQSKIGVNKSLLSFPSGIKNVFVIVMENTNWSDIKGNTQSAPYINSLLARSDASFADQYYNPSRLHPSEPNYVWMEAGASTNLPNNTTTVSFTTDDDPSPSNSTSTKDHLVSLINDSGNSWKTYQEGIDGKVCPLNTNKITKYVPKHNPMIFFQDVTDNNSPNSTYCIQHIRPFEELATDLKKNSVVQYSFITPNNCDDMHDDKGCDTADQIKNGDVWLSKNLPVILRSDSYRQDGVIFITWDEGKNRNDGPIGMMVLSSVAKGNGYHNALHYDHSSLLKTLIEIFNLKKYPGQSQSASDLGDLFR